jgi:hypothetical protein
MLLRNRLPVAGLFLLAATALAAGPAAGQPPVQQPMVEQPALTALTAKSGVARAPEQEAVVFEHADLKFRIDPV